MMAARDDAVVDSHIMAILRALRTSLESGTGEVTIPQLCRHTGLDLQLATRYLGALLDIGIVRLRRSSERETFVSITKYGLELMPPL